MTTLLMASSALGLAAAATAQAPAAPAASASAQVNPAAVVADVRRLIAANYVLPEVRPKLDAVLAKGLAEGRYNVGDPGTLVERINADLDSVAHDKHLGLRYNPEQSARLAAQPQGLPDDGPMPPEWQRQAQSNNHGLVEMKVLPGNIRYLDMTGFVWAGPKSAEAYDNAMRFLKEGDAVIIDLRNNGGGSPEAVQYLVSHFMEPDKKVVTFHMRGTSTNSLSTLATLPAGRMVGKPLYVLTSPRSASAAEEFTGHIAGFKLGELIGETTAGAGFRNDIYPVAGGYLLSVSVGRAVLASTGKDWEGVGIAPTTKVEPAKALDVARIRAMRRLAASAPGPEKARLEALASVLAAKVDPVTPALPLAAYAGTFGERVVRVEDGKLVYQRAPGPKLQLIAVGPNSFTFEDDPMARVEFAVAGDATSGFELVRGDGSRVKADRTK